MDLAWTHLQGEPVLDEALRKSGAQLKAFVGHAPISMAMFDCEMNYLATSDRWLAEYGQGHGRLVGRNHYEVVPDLPEAWKQIHRRGLSGETIKSDADEWVRTDGSRRWLRWAVLPWRDVEGAIGGIIISAEDITESKRTEQALRASEQRYFAIFERAPFAMALTSMPDGRIVAVNDAFTQLLQFSREEVVGRTSVELEISDSGSRDQALSELLARGSVRDFECVRSTKFGAKLVLLVNMDWIDIAGEKHLLTTIRDVTDRRRAEEARERAEEIARLYEKSRELETLKTQFFAGVSHELRTPLALILGPAQTLRDDPLLSDGARQKLEVILRNARLLRSHVDDLLDLSKIEAGQLRVDWAEVDVARLVRIVASRFELLAEERAVTFTLDVSPLHADMDAKILGRVLSNLLSNAFKFTPPRGRVRLTLQKQREWCLLEVADSGPGIPEDKRAIVFERFHQLEGGTTERFGGTGLGLSIVRELVGLQGGSVSVAQAPEGGASFSVLLPLRAPQSATVRSEPCDIEHELESSTSNRPPPAAPGAAGGERPASARAVPGTLVLVVEDNPDMSQFLQDALSADHRVEVAFDGKQGLTQALEHRPDLVLADVGMPNLGGEAFLAAMREHPELATTPVIVLTAQASDELRVRLLRDGAQDFLIKPFSVDELCVRAQNLIAWRRAERRFIGLVESAPDGLVITDRSGVIRIVNREVERMFGYTRAELIGLPVETLVPDSARARHESARAAYVAAPVARPMGSGGDLLARRKDGSEFPIDVSLGVLAEASGEMLVTAAVRDVTAQRRTLEELRNALAAVKTLSGLLPICAWCKCIRDDAGYWQSVEQYLASRTDATFTHGICEGCAARLRDENGL